MENSRPLLWHQGLFLQPQHLQLSGLYHQHLADVPRRVAGPYLWGIVSMDIEGAALGTRTFSVRSSEMIFPDGTWIKAPGNAIIQSRVLEDVWVEDGSPLTVFAGIKKLETQKPNVTMVPNLEEVSQVNTRFIALNEPETAEDIHIGGPPGQVKPLYHVVRIFFQHEKEELGPYTIMPIAQLERSGDEITLSKAFIPPCLFIDSNSTLQKIVKELRDLIASKGHQLQGFKRSRGVHAAEFGSRDMTYLLALMALNRYIPALFHTIETGSVHPWWVYGLVRQLVGEMSSFSERYSVLGRTDDGSEDLPPYDHWNTFPCFSRALETLASLLDEISAGPEYVFEMDFDGTYFTTELRPGVFKTGNRYYLAVTTQEMADKVQEAMATSAKLSSREYLPILIARALPGLGLRHLEVPPHELPRRANTHYFQIIPQGDQWNGVEKGMNLALYWDNAPEDTRVELMVVEVR